jgi:HEAT repeat protein
MKSTPRTSLLLLSAAFFAAVFPTSSHAAAEANGKPIPDFTQDGKPDGSHDWTLGPTGARGWIHTANGHSRDARQILVTAVAKGSPADGVLRAGDVILGTGSKNFSGDARVRFAQAIAFVESDEGGGKFPLLIWREGRTFGVEMKLPVLGSYSATAPYDCQKSERILELGCASLARRMAAADYSRGMHSIPRSQNALALLASGNKDYLPLIQQEAKWAAGFTTSGYLSWDYGYLMIFLAEYVMATGDQSVMPGLKRLALETARGQSAVGTWGHRFVQPNGNLGGYGAMNQPGLTLAIGMVLARDAGVKDPDLDRGIARAAGFLRWYVNKGAIPYGDHPPFPAHEDNGKCSSAAVLFDLLGDREATEFFAKMSTAAYSERERGHTGNYFNMVWALPGVARGGPLAIGAYMKEQAWYYDLARDNEARFLYQGSPVGEEEHNKYTRWDCSGSYLLACALPLKSLRHTGKKAFSIPPFNAAQVSAVIAAGRDFSYKGDPNHYESRSSDQLLAGLSHWSPFVRKRSAAALGSRQGDFLPALLKLLAGSNRDARYGACEALGALGARADAAAPQLRAALQSADPWLQCLAAQAILCLSPAERKASVGDLLALITRSNPADPRRHAALFASTVLFSNFPGARAPKSIIGDSLDGVDRDKLYPAIQALLEHEDSIARSSAAKSYQLLSDRDLVALLPDITRAIEKIAPSNEMFGDGVVLSGLDLLSRLHIREGMALCVSTMQPERWGEKNRTEACLNHLKRYGTHAKPLLPKLQEIRTYLATVKKVDAAFLRKLDENIAAIEASTDTPVLVSLRAFKSRSNADQ